ncbi:MAG: EF-P beta-lysylation protein EpmB [Woeseiaceae bacterium]
MIPRTIPSCQSDEPNSVTTDWQLALAQAFREPAELLDYLNLPQSLYAKKANNDFALRAPRGFCARIEKGNPDDPLLKQILPISNELADDIGFSVDPVGDLAAVEAPGLLHKYHGRVLLVTTPVCAIHCRYCFRRHFPYQENRAEQDWLQAMDYIRLNSDIHEVILSGGDPLSLSDNKLKNITDKLTSIPHIKTLRIHTRQPIVLPERINTSFLNWIASLPWKVVMVVHCNHANEIDTHVAHALQQLQQHDILLLNQSVLLAGVNDNVASLAALSEKLFEHHVLPYYLHLLDKVKGAKHFDVDVIQAKKIMAELRSQLPGYLVPKLVQENHGESSKTVVF